MPAVNLMQSVNPATGEKLAEYPAHSPDETGDRLTRCREAFRAWSRRPVDERAPVLARAGALLRKRRDELARLATLEMGKTIVAAEAEVEKCAWVCDHYAQHAAGYLAEEKVASEASETYVRFDPLGVLLAIMPWNFPYWQAFRAAVPALVAGNTVALKHASNVTGCALAMERLWRDAGLLEDAFTVLFVQGAEASALAAHTAVAAVTLTGSEPAGASVAAIAGRALKKVVLELGGSDPFIVLDSDDLAKTVKDAVAGRMGNAGQACTAAKRMIVVGDLYDEFTDQFTAAMAALRPGDPTDPASDLGPLSSEGAAERLMGQISDAVDKGATLRTGGKRVDRPGAFVEPTVLTDVTPQMRAYHEELFGPAAVIYRVADASQAVELANSSPFGLGGVVYSADPGRAQEVADLLETGMVWINSPQGSMADLPFGGTKRSGVGRELGPYGIDEFVNKKLIYTPAPR